MRNILISSICSVYGNYAKKLLSKSSFTFFGGGKPILMILMRLPCVKGIKEQYLFYFCRPL